MEWHVHPRRHDPANPKLVAETVNGRLNRFEDKLAWWPLSTHVFASWTSQTPITLREFGYYVPKPNETSHPVEKGQGVAIQMNDVDLDDRGLAYATDRTGRTVYTSAHGNHGPIGHVRPVNERGKAS